MIMQKRIEILEQENKELKKRLADVAKIKGEVDVKQYMKDNNVSPSYNFYFFFFKVLLERCEKEF